MTPQVLAGKTGVVFGVANKRSIAWAIAKAWASAGAKLIGLEPFAALKNQPVPTENPIALEMIELPRVAVLGFCGHA